MHHHLKLLTIVFLFIILPLANRVHAAEHTLGLDVGFYDGTGWHLHWETANFAQGFTTAVRLGIGRSSMDPGNSADARRIFINNATNGVPEAHGSMWNYRLDLLFPVSIKSLTNTRLFVGPRYTKFKGNFKYIGGNEDFDVVSNHWGFGLGLESSFTISRKISLRLGSGIDYFKKTTLQGHDTSYSPDGVIVNQREDYTYEAADKAINQPGIELRLMAGFYYRF